MQNFDQKSKKKNEIALKVKYVWCIISYGP